MALDQVSANVVLADTKREVVYMDRVTCAMLQEVETDFRVRNRR